jgi:hypothetical protein
MATIGSPSVVAVAAPVTRLPVPGPEVTRQTPGLPVKRPTAAAMNAAFCSCRTDDQTLTLIVQYVKSRHDFPTRDAEYMFDILLHQASDQQLCGGLLAALYFRHCEFPDMSSFAIAVLRRYQSGRNQHLPYRAMLSFLDCAYKIAEH